MISSNFHNIVTSEIFKKEKKEKIDNIIKIININNKLKIHYPIKKFYNNVIPLNIYQTWHSKNLPPLMYNAISKVKFNNPAFTYYLFDDDDCRKFIKNNFDIEILNTYDSLIPGAYKADLWRYCVLYKNGGIYLDVKYLPVNKFKFINLTENEHWVLDADKNGIYNALIISKPNNPILFAAINKIVENVKKNFYGNNALDPTGPGLLSQFFSNEEKSQLDMYHDYYNYDNRYIYFNNYIILKSYKGYINEHNNNKKMEYYGNLWESRQIYR
jgi:mannosyltransferase OCH1-like enzyme